MFTKKKRLKLMSLIITGSLLGGMYTSTNIIPVQAATEDRSSVVVVNSTFEDTSGWWGSGSAKIATVTTGSGAYLAVTGRSDNWNGPQTSLSGKIKVGKTYETSVWVKFDGEGTKKFNVTLGGRQTPNPDKKGEFITHYDRMTEQVDVKANEWTQITGTFTCLEGIVDNINAYVEIDDATTSFDIDNFKITTEASEDAPQTTSYSESFEDGLNDWKARGGEVSQDSSQKQEGNNSLKISGRTKTWEGPIKDLTKELKAGESYHFSAYVMYNDSKGADSQSFALQAQNIITGETDPKYATIGTVTATKGNWTKIEGDYKVPSSSTGFSLYLELKYKADKEVVDSDKIDFYLDNVVITQKEIVEKDYQRDIPKLREVFNDYFPVGTCVNPQQIDGSDVHTDFIKYQYNTLVPGNFMKPDAMQPTEGNFVWNTADEYVKFGEENKMVLRGHTLVWHSQIPDWFFEDPTDSTKPATSEQLRSRLETHIKTVVGRYKGKIKYWDVVNEVISDSSGLRGENENSKWKSIIGDLDGDGYDSDYIELAFKYAYEADPDAILMINDYGTEGSTRKRDDLYNLVERMLKKGIPVGGVGLQSHISMYSPSAQQNKECIEKFATLKEYNPDFTVQVTELDMSIYSSDSEAEKKVTDDINAQQAKQYKELFDVYKEEADKGNLSLVMLWGNSDDDTWLDTFPVKAGRLNSPMLFDRNLQAKPAYWAIVDPSKVDVFKQELNVANGTPVIGSSVDKKWMTIKPFDVSSYVKGIDGATAKVKTMWDANNLYVLADVNDETVGDKDSVDIFVDNGSEEYIKYSINRTTNNDTIKVTPTSTGYQIQAKLPLGDIAAKLGTKIVFDMKINDNDSNGEITSSVVWNDYASEASADKLNLENGGTLLLSPESKLVEAKKATPNIDGDIDGIWNTANVLSTDVSVQGTDTAKAKVKTLWDKDYIYALYEVIDSNLDKTSKNAYEQDSVETFIDENNARASAYDNDDAQYRVNYDNEQSGAGNRITDKFKSATKVTDNGYIVEMAIPLNNEAVANQIIGFDAQVNDATDGSREGVTIWCDETGLTWSNMQNIGNLLLVDSTNTEEGNNGSSNNGSSHHKHSSTSSTDIPKADDTLQEGWQLDSNNKWKFVENGKNTTGWKLVDNKWYYMNNNGEMLTGWIKDANEKWYFLNSNGDMATGWIKDTNGKWYFLNSSGDMATGWVKDIDGKWYFLNNSGEMLYNTTIDGYNLGFDGAWIQ